MERFRKKGSSGSIHPTSTYVRSETHPYNDDTRSNRSSSSASSSDEEELEDFFLEPSPLDQQWLAESTGDNHSDDRNYTRNASNIDNGDTEKKKKTIMQRLLGPSGMLLGGILGLVLGIVLKTRVEITDDLKSWIAFPGQLFIRALTALVAPLLFTTLSVSVSDVVQLGQWKGLGKLATLLFVFTSLIAAVEGVLWSLLIKSIFESSEKAILAESNRNALNDPMFALKCVNGMYLSRSSTDNNTLLCDAEQVSSRSEFYGSDVSGAFQFINSTSSTSSESSLTVLTHSLLNQLVPENIVAAFAEGSLYGIVGFAIIFGFTMALMGIRLRRAAAAAVEDDRQTASTMASFDSFSEAEGDDDIEEEDDLSVPEMTSASVTAALLSGHNFVLEVVRQLNRMLLLVVSYVMKLCPLAVLFLLAAMIVGDEDEQLNIVSNTLFFFGFLVIAQLTHVFVTLPALYILLHRKSPYLFMRKMIPAMVFAFGSASSMDTLPVTIYCLDSTKQTSKALSRVVLRVGATVNMNGLAMYIPMAVIFVFQTTGRIDELTPWVLVNLVLLSTVASIGAAPVANGGLLMLLAVWQSIVAGAALPVTFPILIAFEWLEDRIQTAVNVIGDALVALLLAPLVNQSYAEEKEWEEQQASGSGFSRPILNEEIVLTNENSMQKQITI